MNRIVCSLYYPHNQINVLVKYGILHLVGFLNSQKKIAGFNFFLSMYKGENAAMIFYYRIKDEIYLRNIIIKDIQAFMSKYKYDYREEELPVNRFFLNIEPNTLHFWKEDPFSYSDLFKRHKKEEIRIGSRISQLCLNELSGIKKMESENIITLYFKLFLVYKRIIEEYKSGDFNLFLDKLIRKIQDLIPNSFSRIDQLQNQVQSRFIRDKDFYEKLQTLDDQQDYLCGCEAGADSVDDEWFIVVRDAIGIHYKEGSGISHEFLIRIFFSISQKISLQIDRLILSAIVARQYFER